jgi:glycosyltransferase involved in cell wall biosynthesis
MEVVEEGVTGLLVPPADPAALARAMAWLLADSERLRTMGRAARDRAADCFDVRRMVADYESLYDSLSRRLDPDAL